MSQGWARTRDARLTDVAEVDDETIDDNTATIQGSQGTSQNEYTNRSQQTTHASEAEHSQRSNTADEDDFDEGDAEINSDKGVEEVMEGMKNWTKSSPFPGDAEYLFPRETRTRRRRAEKASRLKGLLGTAFGGERALAQIDYQRATGGPAPYGLLPMPRALVGEDHGGKSPLGGDGAVENVGSRLNPSGLATPASAEPNNENPKSCVPCMIYGTGCPGIVEIPTIHFSYFHGLHVLEIRLWKPNIFQRMEDYSLHVSTHQFPSSLSLHLADRLGELSCPDLLHVFDETSCRQTRKNARARRSTPKMTAMAMLAFAPPLRLEEGEVEDEAEEVALDVGEGVAVFGTVFELVLGLDVIVEADIKVKDEDAPLKAAVPIIELAA